MKKLSDYQGEEAIDLWADLLEPLTVIFTDEEVKKIIRDKSTRLAKISKVIKLHKPEVAEILTRVDNTPINGFNMAIRALVLLNEFEKSEEFAGFFG